METQKNVLSNNKIYMVWQNIIKIVTQTFYENYENLKLAFLSYLNNLEVAIGENLSLATTNHISLSSTRQESTGHFLCYTNNMIFICI